MTQCVPHPPSNGSPCCARKSDLITVYLETLGPHIIAGNSIIKGQGNHGPYFLSLLGCTLTIIFQGAFNPIDQKHIIEGFDCLQLVFVELFKNECGSTHLYKGD